MSCNFVIDTYPNPLNPRLLQKEVTVNAYLLTLVYTLITSLMH